MYLSKVLHRCQGLRDIQWRDCIVFVVCLAVETWTIFFVSPGTKGPSLEEVAMVIEGEKANVEVIEAGAFPGKVGVQQGRKGSNSCTTSQAVVN